MAGKTSSFEQLFLARWLPWFVLLTALVMVSSDGPRARRQGLLLVTRIERYMSGRNLSFINLLKHVVLTYAVLTLSFASRCCLVCSRKSTDGEARPASQPCTPGSSSAGKPNPDKAAVGVDDDGNIITPFVFRRTLKAVVVTSPTSHGGSECCHN